MQDINEIITNNFNQNIEYLQKEHPKVFQKLSALDMAIENGHYQDKYELVYENDGFDVYEKSTQNYLYNKESLAHSLISQNSVNFRTDNHVIEGFARHNFTQKELAELAEAKPLSDYRKNIAQIISYIQNNHVETKELLKLDKFVFFGVGVGSHIETIDKKIHSQVYFIVEDDLELFRLSLFTINYKTLAKSATLVLSIFEDRDEFMESSSIFLDTKSYYNHYLKFFHLLSHSEEKIDFFQMAVMSQPHLRFLFSNSMLQYTQPLKYIYEGYNVLNKRVVLDKELNSMPFLLLASGPSLQNNKKWLQKHYSHYITIAVSSSLAYLESIGVTPNIILHIDPFEWGITSFEKLQSLEFIKDSICLFGTSTPDNIVSLIKKERLFFLETDTKYKNDSLKLSAPCVGSMGLQILLVLQAKNIYLLGLDLAIDTKTGKTHSGEHQSQKALTHDAGKSQDAPISYKETLLKREGNLTPFVETTPSYYSSIYTIELFLKHLKKDTQEIYNLSNGVKFSHTKSFAAEKLSVVKITPNKLDLAVLQEYFMQHSSSKLTKKDMLNYSLKLSHAQGLLTALETFKTPKNSSIDDTILAIYTQFASDADIDTYELSRVLDDYLHYISSYIVDYFNEAGTLRSSSELEELSQMLLKELQEIITYYTHSLKKSPCKI